MEEDSEVRSWTGLFARISSYFAKGVLEKWWVRSLGGQKAARLLGLKGSFHWVHGEKRRARSL